MTTFPGVTPPVSTPPAATERNARRFIKLSCGYRKNFNVFSPRLMLHAKRVNLLPARGELGCQGARRSVPCHFVVFDSLRGSDQSCIFHRRVPLGLYRFFAFRDQALHGAATVVCLLRAIVRELRRMGNSGSSGAISE